MTASGYLAIEAELQKRREQIDSVKGKDTPFRVEFRYRGRTRHYQYFQSKEDASGAQDSLCSYGPFGNARIEKPTSSQVQRRGPRGGWSPEREERGER